jgi:hypothetical protein
MKVVKKPKKKNKSIHQMIDKIKRKKYTRPKKYDYICLDEKMDINRK